MIDRINKKHESDNFVYLPLEEDKKSYKADIINIDGREVLKVPRSDFELYEKQCQIGQIMWSNVAANGKVNIDKFMPKAPWRHIVRKYELKKAVKQEGGGDNCK